MLGNIKKLAIGGYRLVKKPIVILFSPITAVVNTAREFSNYRYFDPKLKDVQSSGKKTMIENEKFCRYAPDEVFEKGKLNENKDKLQFKGREFPLKKLESSVDGNILYLINVSSHYKDFGLSLEEREKQELVIAADDSGKLVNPVKNLKGKERDIKIEEKGVKISPYSFAVKDRKLNNLWVLSLALLPLNLGGSLIGFAGRLTSGILDKIGGAIQNLSNNMLKNSETALANEKEGIFKSGNNNKVSAVCSAILGVVASIFLTSSSVVRGASEFAEAVMRVPTPFLNALINDDGVSFKAGVGALKKPLVNFYGDMKSVGNNFVNNIEQLQKVFTGNIGKEDSKLAVNQQNERTANLNNNQAIKSIDLKNDMKKLGQDLNESGVRSGVSSSVPERRIGSDSQLKKTSQNR